MLHLTALVYKSRHYVDEEKIKTKECMTTDCLEQGMRVSSTSYHPNIVYLRDKPDLNKQVLIDVPNEKDIGLLDAALRVCYPLLMWHKIIRPPKATGTVWL